ncbi:hypothetical protein TNCV_3438591 [Trichonephila clavipes]|nr:hypothetical protein TNCV_3438591 [Trichonephila clavipes]
MSLSLFRVHQDATGQQKVPRQKKRDEHPPPRGRGRMSLLSFRVHQDTTGGARMHFDLFSLGAFSTSIGAFGDIFGHMAREASLHPISDNLMGNDCGYFMLVSSS